MSWADLAGILRKKSIRKGWRAPVRMPVWVIDDFKHQHVCELVEASPTGFRLRTAHKLPRGKELILRFFSGPSEEESGRHGFARKGAMVDIPGEIVWVRKEGVGAFSILAGGRFTAEGRKDWEALCEVLLHGPGIDVADLDEHRSHGRLTYQGSLGQQEMVIRDVSESGAGLLTRRSIPMGTRMEITLEARDFLVTCRGRVVRCQEILKGRVFHVGLDFEKLDRETRENLVRFLTDLLAQRAEAEAAEVARKAAEAAKLRAMETELPT